MNAPNKQAAAAQTVTVPEPRHLMTVKDLIDAIPPAWRKARIAIRDGENEIYSLHRVELVQCDDGSRVVVITDRPIKHMRRSR